MELQITPTQAANNKGACCVSSLAVMRDKSINRIRF